MCVWGGDGSVCRYRNPQVVGSGRVAERDERAQRRRTLLLANPIRVALWSGMEGPRSSSRASTHGAVRIPRQRASQPICLFGHRATAPLGGAHTGWLSKQAITTRHYTGIGLISPTRLHASHRVWAGEVGKRHDWALRKTTAQASAWSGGVLASNEVLEGAQSHRVPRSLHSVLLRSHSHGARHTRAATRSASSWAWTSLRSSFSSESSTFAGSVHSRWALDTSP